MPMISITRLRTRSWIYLPAFFFQTLRINKQAAAAEGNLAVRLLRDHGNTFWTATSWSSARIDEGVRHRETAWPGDAQADELV